MVWIIALGKALLFALACTFAAYLVADFPLLSRTKAAGLTAVLGSTGQLLLFASIFQLSFAVLMLRVNIFIDGGRLQVTLR